MVGDFGGGPRAAQEARDAGGIPGSTKCCRNSAAKRAGLQKGGFRADDRQHSGDAAGAAGDRRAKLASRSGRPITMGILQGEDETTLEIAEK